MNRPPHPPRVPLLLTYASPSELSFSAALVIGSLTELLLMEIKYNMFQGGFLQSYQLTGSAIALFILTFIFFNFVAYGIFYLCIKHLTRLLGSTPSVSALHFFMLCAISVASLLAIQFKLHQYFSDAIDLNLLKNIAGGSVKSALRYAADETTLLLAPVVLLAACYVLAYRLLNARLRQLDRQLPPPNKNRSPWLATTCITVLIPTTLLINQHDELRHALNRSTAFPLISKILNRASDLDGDGFGYFTVPTDSHHRNDQIYPGALDIPNNGIDEDGYFGDYQYRQSDFYLNPKRSPRSKPKHIVIIILESARHEIVNKQLDGRAIAPNLRHLAKTGQSIDEAYSHTGYTSSSLSAIFSGRLGYFQPDESIFKELTRHDYEIAVFSGQDESWGQLDEKLASRESAQFFYDAQSAANERVFSSKLPSSIKLSESSTWQAFKQYSESSNWDKPKFIYFNMQAGHFPYYHTKMSTHFVEKGIPRSQINQQNVDWLRRTYWNAMNHADRYIGHIVAELRLQKTWSNTLLLIVGDHGEELFDNGHLGHGFHMSDHQTKVPLIINDSDITIPLPVGHSDLKDLLLSHALYQPEPKTVTQQPKFVFQMVGSLARPSKIGLRYPHQQSIALDLKNNLVKTHTQQQWQPYQIAVADKKTLARLQELIFHWEKLRWQEHQARQIPKAASL